MRNVLFLFGILNSAFSQKKHPTKEQMLDGVQLNVTTCEKFPWDDCQNERTIYVILCNRLFHYFLKQTSKNSGYCFDLPDPQTDNQNVTAPSITLNESSTGVSIEAKTSSSITVIVGAVLGAVAGFAIVIAVIITTCILVQRRPNTQSRNGEHRTDNNRNYNTSERSTTNDGHVYYNDSKDYKQGAPTSTATRVYVQLNVSGTNLEHLASDEAD